MKRWIELTEEETTLANEIYKMLFGHPEVQEVIKKQGFVDLRITIEHWCRIINLLIDKGEVKRC
uniref:Uncharacterized protein n=1 Tax=viral metagenome TaxID=1070528 RepID=A0A6M3LDC8_9ZZZZ